MKSRPMVFNILAAAMLMISIGFPVQIMMAYGHMPWEVSAILSKIAPLNWLVISLALIQIPFLLRSSQYLLYSTPLLALVIMHNNAIVAYMGMNASVLSVIFASVGFLALCSLLLTNDARITIYNPGRRWWLSAKRHDLHIDIRIEDVTTKEVVATQTYDLSKNGAFISFSENDVLERFANCMHNSQMKVQMFIHDQGVIDCKGSIVRKLKSKVGKYEEGIGIKFHSMPIIPRLKLEYFLMQSSIASAL